MVFGLRLSTLQRAVLLATLALATETRVDKGFNTEPLNGEDECCGQNRMPDTIPACLWPKGLLSQWEMGLTTSFIGEQCPADANCCCEWCYFWAKLPKGDLSDRYMCTCGLAKGRGRGNFAQVC